MQTSEVLDSKLPNAGVAVVVDKPGFLLLGHDFDAPLVLLLLLLVLGQDAAVGRPALVHGDCRRLVQANPHFGLRPRVRVDQNLSDLQPDDVLKVQASAICVAIKGDRTHSLAGNCEVRHLPQLLWAQTAQVRGDVHRCAGSSLLIPRLRCSAGAGHGANVRTTPILGLGQIDSNGSAPHGQRHHRHADSFDQLFVKVGVGQLVAQLFELLLGHVPQVQPLQLLEELGLADHLLQSFPPGLRLSEKYGHSL
mmetsp:Transcript_117448/g.278861  ORF Transcript_117448/g.278861 Transcript_117448/m.278861 type:complete len:251 (-) Transcript_117448:1425-2177(-)